MGFIYKITNTVNQATYIGKTSKTISERFAEHLQAARYWKEASLANKPLPYKSLLYLAMIKYGLDKFKIEIVEELPNNKLNIAEKHWIAAYKAKGQAEYNIASGGNGGDLISQLSQERKQQFRENLRHKNSGSGNPMYKKHHTEEAKNKIKASYTPERLEQYRQQNSGENNPQYHKHPWNYQKEMPAEIKEKCRLANSGTNNNNYGRHYGEAFNHRPVILIKADGTRQEFSSKLECGEYLGYAYGGNVPIGKIIKSKNPIRNNCLVIYKN